MTQLTARTKTETLSVLTLMNLNLGALFTTGSTVDLIYLLSFEDISACFITIFCLCLLDYAYVKHSQHKQIIMTLSGISKIKVFKVLKII